MDARLDRVNVVRKRRSLRARTEGAWVRIERQGFDRIGEQGWNCIEAAAVSRDVVMPEWYQGVAWRDAGEPVMWRADEMELDVTLFPQAAEARIKPVGVRANP
ncbi:hypothetical protein ACH4TC_00925 [Streptomyces spororaveus]|uniref:hypothetical protein n=1 Tax=Streptomyces spororaveus TaxID=284039 RepID=UPI0037960120